MRYLKKFKNYSEYREYLEGDDIWLPRVSLIVNSGDFNLPESTRTQDDGQAFVDFSRLANLQFVEYVNRSLYFTDQVYDNISYKAWVSGDTLHIESRNLNTGQLTDDCSIVEGDDGNNYISIRYPDGKTLSYSLI